MPQKYTSLKQIAWNGRPTHTQIRSTGNERSDGFNPVMIRLYSEVKIPMQANEALHVVGRDFIEKNTKIRYLLCTCPKTSWFQKILFSQHIYPYILLEPYSFWQMSKRYEQEWTSLKYKKCIQPVSNTSMSEIHKVMHFRRKIYTMWRVESCQTVSDLVLHTPLYLLLTLQNAGKYLITLWGAVIDWVSSGWM